MRARFHYPGIRRFVTQDEVWGDVADSQRMNLCVYVQGNPFIYTDQTGMARMLNIPSRFATHMLGS